MSVKLPAGLLEMRLHAFFHLARLPPCLGRYAAEAAPAAAGNLERSETSAHFFHELSVGAEILHDLSSASAIAKFEDDGLAAALFLSN